jgi:phasin
MRLSFGSAYQGGGTTLMSLCNALSVLESPGRNTIAVVSVSFERTCSVSDASMNLEIDSNAKTGAGEKRGFDLPFFTMPGIFGGFAEQGAVRAKEGCDRMKAASGEMADILREACSSNAKGAADYSAKVLEISNANTNSAFDFMARLMDTRSMSDIVDLSTAQSRKALEVASVQNRELWELAQKVTTATAEPFKRSLSRVVQKAC